MIGGSRRVIIECVYFLGGGVVGGGIYFLFMRVVIGGLRVVNGGLRVVIGGFCVVSGGLRDELLDLLFICELLMIWICRLYDVFMGV